REARLGGSEADGRVFEWLRSLEERLERATKPEENPWKPRVAMKREDAPAGIPANHFEHVRLMMDMIALAFETDTTRIATFLFGNEVSNQNFSVLEGVKGGHHDLSHHQNNEDKLRMYQLVNRWHIAQYGYLINKLSQMKEGEGSVLDQSMVVFGSGLRDGNSHNPHNLPVVVAGKGGGRLATGQHLSYGTDTPLANLWVSMLDAFGSPVERFADSTEPLRGVLAS